MTGDRGKAPRPEYITTASVAFELCDLAVQIAPQMKMTVHCEERTGEVWRRGLVRSFLQSALPAAQMLAEAKLGAAKHSHGGDTRKRERREAKRKGNIDITLYQGRGFEHPFAIIENKGVLTFTKAGQLGAGSVAEVDKDLKRNADFVDVHGAQGGVQYSAFTFYLRDSKSVLRTQGMQFCAEMKSFFEQHLLKLALPAHLRTDVLVREWDSELCTSSEQIEQLAREGEAVEPWHLAYGIISIYRVGKDISDHEQLAGSP